MELWELVARERIRDSIARYNWAGDAGRLEELTAVFCEDGALEVKGDEAHHGRAGILAFLGGTVSDADAARRRDPGTAGSRRIVRHVLTNTRFLELAAEHAVVGSYFTVFTEVGLDHYGRYRDRFVPVGDEWLIEHRLVSTDWRSPDSAMARASTPS